MVEMVPSQWTSPEVVTRTRELLTSVGLVPVLVKKEVPGFVLNRLQYAIMGEAWRLVRVGQGGCVQYAITGGSLATVQGRSGGYAIMGEAWRLVKVGQGGCVQYAIMGEAWRLVRVGQRGTPSWRRPGDCSG